MPKKTVKTILDSGNSYLIEVKGNQKGLLQQIKEEVASNMPIDTYLSSEKNRGRQENRYHEIYEMNQTLADGWQSIQRIIYVHRYGHRPDKQSDEGQYDEQHYYISNYTFKCAKTVALGIRQHWGIENKIHHVKDTFWAFLHIPTKR